MLMRRITSLLAIPFYPLLIGVYAVLFLWSVNVGQMVPVTVKRSLIGSVVLCLLVFLACFAVWHNLRKSALFSGLLLIVFFSYGHLYALLENISIAGLLVGRHRFLIAFFALLSVLSLVLLIRWRGNLRNVTILLNIVTLVMVFFVSIPIIGYEIRYGSHLYRDRREAAAVQVTPAESMPDVYYIILDGYTSADILNSVFGLDNQDFIDGLEQMGFYLPKCAYSNYTKTTPSLSATFNMEYLNKLGISERAALDPFDATLAPLMVQSKVRQEFERMGYKIAAFHGYMPVLDLLDADYYFSAEVQEGQFNLSASMKFEHMLLGTTMLQPVVEAFESGRQDLEYYLPDALTDILYVRTESGPYPLTAERWRKESEFTFQVLPTIAKLPGKKFVYAHFYSTHNPFVFDEDGGFLPQSMYNDPVAGYTNAVKYTNKRLLPILQGLIEGSPVKPIIILQGDHGSTTLQGIAHNKILNAYYFPDQDYSRLYDTITPVNTFRVVLNQFFQQNYALLPDTLMISEQASNERETVRYLPAACDGR
jgi:hypothetical protein